MSSSASKIRSALVALGTVFCLSTPNIWASDDAATISQLRAELRALSARLETLEAQPLSEVAKSAAVAASKPQPSALQPADRIKLNADLRYRYESIDVEGKPDRLRNRIRARVGMKATINDSTLLRFELASGSHDPISTNQTLGDNFSSKGVNIEQAYIAANLQIRI